MLSIRFKTLRVRGFFTVFNNIQKSHFFSHIYDATNSDKQFALNNASYYQTETFVSNVFMTKQKK